MTPEVCTLQREYRQIRQYLDMTLLPRWANAVAHQLPTADVLQCIVLARYDQLAALTLAIASYDPQQRLFADGEDLP